ncbi:MAG: plasmid pRiA4b ORF-3 family protein [Nitrospirae bacterium]|nr:plasmid pRiA4b ORF-3 family protein [Nitrospirota bacterium]
MKKDFKQIYQFKITLKDIKPPVWRRIMVPGTFTFENLHFTIQDAMGWSDSHLHAFFIVNPATGMKEEIGNPNGGDPFDDVDDSEILSGRKKMISRYFTIGNKKANYVYDFGDNWEHVVLLEKILPRDDTSIKYPVCIGGKRACPPEDCGGPWGYEGFLDAITDPKREEHDEMLEWAGEEFTPEHFDPKEIKFRYSW